MDSKLRWMTILSSAAVILLVALLVLYVNREDEGEPNHSGMSADAAAGQETEEQYNDGQIGNDLKAFLEDNTFFDQEINPVLEEAMGRAFRLSLVVTSVEKDLRVQIVDRSGELVSGESFCVKLDGAGEYEDSDRDGVIYIDDLEAGDYYVELLPVEGYRVPENETRVHVKEKVEYLAIDDIWLLIRNEEDLDVEAEDTVVRDALADADKTEIKKLQKSSGSSRTGISVSGHDGEIDWDKVRNAGVEFAVIRAGYRGSVTGSLVRDPLFAANMKGAAASGMPLGVSFFSQAVNEVEAVEEASAVLEFVKEYNLEYPIFIDTDSAGGSGRADGLDVETRTRVCEAFCGTIENAGYRAGVYGSRSRFNNDLYADRLDKYCIWLAEYRSVPVYQGYYQMWQYTSKAKVAGIEGGVAVNISYIDDID